MTQSSILWTNNATGDGITGGYTQAQHIEWMRALFAKSNGGGVSVDYLNELAVSGATSPVAVATGAAVVYGFIYFNGASEDIAVPTPSSATRIDRIVLRADWTAQTVRLARVAGSEGGGAPSLTQTPSTTWEIPLAQVSITTLGAITLTDQREYISGIPDGYITSVKFAAGAVDTTAIDDEAVTADKVGVGGLFLSGRKGGAADNWQTAGTGSHVPATAVQIVVGRTALEVVDGEASPVLVTFSPAMADTPMVIATAGLDYTIQAFGNDEDSVVLAAKHVSSTTIDETLEVSWIAIGPKA